MIFYSIKAGDRTIDWADTQAKAKQLCSEYVTTADKTIGWHTEEVPTDKPSLLAWLKVNALGERKRKQAAEPLPPSP